jgi:hypothetical protein
MPWMKFSGKVKCTSVLENKLDNLTFYKRSNSNTLNANDFTWTTSILDGGIVVPCYRGVLEEFPQCLQLM